MHIDRLEKDDVQQESLCKSHSREDCQVSCGQMWQRRRGQGHQQEPHAASYDQLSLVQGRDQALEEEGTHHPATKDGRGGNRQGLLCQARQGWVRSDLVVNEDGEQNPGG